MSHYVDTSAWLKLYFCENGSDWFHGLFADRNAMLYSSAVLQVECASALVRARKGLRLTEADFDRRWAQFQRDIGYVTLVNADSVLLERAMDVAWNHALRGYDALHFATFLSLNDLRAIGNFKPLVLVSADKELIAVAKKDGHDVEDPETH